MKLDILVPANVLHEAFAGCYPFVQIDSLELGIRDLDHICKVGDKPAHAVTPFHAYLHHFAQVIRVFRILQGIAYGFQGRCNACYGIVYFVCNHADYFLVGFLFSFYNFGGQAFDEDERVGKSPVDKRESGAAVDHGVAQTYGFCLVTGNAVQFLSQRRIQFFNLFSGQFFRSGITHKPDSGLIEHGNVIIEIQDDHSHGRSADQQIQEMILFTQAETFVFQLFHHAVEHLYDAVGILLSYGRKPAAEVLFAQQFHSVSDTSDRFHYLLIKINKEEECDQDYSFCQIKQQPPILQDKSRNQAACCQQQEGENEELSSYFHTGEV